MAILAGGSEWRAVPGTNRARFVATSGPYVDQEITRRGLEDIRAKAKGLPSYRTFQELKNNREYLEKLGMYSGATKTRRVEVRRVQSEFTELFLAAYLKPDGTLRTYAETMNDAIAYPDAPSTRALVDLLIELGFFRSQADFQRYITTKR